MEYIEQVAFIIVVGIAAFILTKRIKQIRSNILLGKDVDLSDNQPDRLKNMFLVAFGQQKMFKSFIPAI